MPRRRRVPKLRTRSARLLDWQRQVLEVGWSLFGKRFAEEFANDQEHRECWEQHRDVVLPEYIVEFPGRRPDAWWRFDAPEPRCRDEEQWVQLARLGILGRAERDALMVILKPAEVDWLLDIYSSTTPARGRLVGVMAKGKGNRDNGQ